MAFAFAFALNSVHGSQTTSRLTPHVHPLPQVQSGHLHKLLLHSLNRDPDIDTDADADTDAGAGIHTRAHARKRAQTRTNACVHTHLLQVEAAQTECLASIQFDGVGAGG